MPELPKETGPENPERREALRAILTISGSVAVFGCGAVASEPEVPEIETSEPENPRPEWVNGPEVFEKDGYIYAVGKSEGAISSNLECLPEDARLKARELLCQSILPETSEKISGCALLERDANESHEDYMTDPNNGFYTYYVLMRAKKPELSEIEDDRPDWVDGPKIFEDDRNNYYTVGSDPVIDIPPANDENDLHAARARAIWHASDDFRLVVPGHSSESKNEGEEFLMKILDGSESFAYKILDTYVEKRDDEEDIMHVLIKIR